MSGSPPAFRHAAVIGNFLVTGFQPSAQNKVQWSSFNDPTSWTAGVNQADSEVLPEGGVITAGNASQITDGAAALLICNDEGLKKVKSDPRARIIGISVVGDDPILMLGGPIPASHKVLKETKLTIDDIDLYEVNEAFAPVPLSWAIELKADMAKLNVNGGAMALGHPLGATGAKLMTTLLHELERTSGKYGLQAICEGGGTANATIIERI